MRGRGNREWKTRLLFYAVAVAVTVAVTAPGRAQEPYRELRIQMYTSAYRWSRIETTITVPYATRPELEYNVPYSLHIGPALGYRQYRRGGSHGGWAEVEYLSDPDMDGVTDEALSSGIDFAVARGGYAFRRENVHKHPRGRRKGALTLRGGLTAGLARSDYVLEGVPARSAVLGFVAALDYDMFFGRFFMGGSLGYEFLFHLDGVVTGSAFIRWNAIPVAHLGVSFGGDEPPSIGGDPPD